MTKTHLLNNSLALSSSLRAKSCNRSYSASLGLVFKLVCTPLAIQYGTKPTPLQYSALLQYPRHPISYSSSQIGPLGWPTGGMLQSSPLRTRRPRRVPDQPKYQQDLLSWPRPIRLVLTVPCAMSVRPVPTVPVRRPCLARARPHALASAPPCARAHARALMPICGVKPRESALIPL